MASPIVSVFDDEDRLAHGAAGAIVVAAGQAIAKRGHFHWAVAGGGTPKRTYRALALPPHHEGFPWDRFDAWIGDERIVPADDPASNRRMVLEHLFQPAGADPAALRPYDTAGGDPAGAARAYAGQLEKALPANADGVPVLDLILLGLGADTHTASWFPGSSFPDERWAVVTDGEYGGHRRLTLTPATVNAARSVLFLVSGAAKRQALRRVFDGPKDPLAVPAQRVAPTRGQLTWMIDRDAAGQFFAD
jgi:6-phosphogluconolactonase